MNALPALVLLPGLGPTPEPRALAQRLREVYVTLTPDLAAASSGGPFALTTAADVVGDVVAASGHRSATLCGIGLGALVALQVATDHPEQVSRLVLLTRSVAASPILLSVSAAVLRLLPVSTVQRLGMGQDQLLALLDQVRPVDYQGIAGRVRQPAVVLCGQRDRLNRRASATLARRLRSGELRLVPGADESWLDDPDILAEALRQDATKR